MLDLRSISNEGSEYKWYPLSRNKYKTHKPQVRLMLSTEEPDGEPQQVNLSNVLFMVFYDLGHFPSLRNFSKTITAI